MTQTACRMCAIAATFGLSIATPVSADPTFGIGLTITFGGGQPQIGAGVRVFSDDDEDEFVASIGLDYVITNQNFRPSIGAAYLFDSGYVGLDLGYGLNGAGFDVGIGGGYADTEDDKNRSAPAAPPAPPPVVTEGPPV